MHLSMVPHNRFGDLVEAALRVEQSTTAMYQSRQESKRSAHQALLNRALVSTIERKASVEVVEAEVGPQGCRQRPALRPEFML